MYRIFMILVLANSVQPQDLDDLLEDFVPNLNGPVTNPTTTTSTVNPAIDEIRPSTFVPPPDSNYTSCDLNGKEGACVPYYLCNKNNKVNTDGEGSIDIRVIGDCPSYLDICCLIPDQRPPTYPITPKPDPLKSQRNGCGWANREGIGMKTTGETDGESKFGEFPWMVAILNIKSKNDNNPSALNLIYVGGGSLIHPSVVLTAAHVVAGKTDLSVRAGEWDTRTIDEIYPHQDREVESIVVHKDFNDRNLFYDVALLFLISPVDMAPNVGVACLPAQNNLAIPNTRCLASGWGKNKFEKENEYQVILKKIEVPVIDRQICLARLRTTRLGNLFQLHTAFMCAGGEPGKDTCKGDGGSPLVCPIEFENDRYMQYGIVSWGMGCGDAWIPGVYVDVLKVRDWIDDKVKGKRYQTDVYTY